jgi:phosphoribosylaminoimidazole-succinocarboxamide synthase
VVKKAKPLPVECVVRGYLAGSGWKDYQATQAICGVALPAGLRQAEQLPETIFTPSTKAASGHDMNISWDECRRLVGDDIAEQVRAMSIRIYEGGRAYAAEHGIIVADTKFEFGLYDGRLILIDECLTPDSSRFWPSDQHALGISPPSYDKQFVRDYLETLDWNKTTPAPALPPEVIRKTSEKYREAYARLTGSELPVE